MTVPRHWWRAASRISLLALLGAALGILLDDIALGLLCSALALLVFWYVQLFRVERWLAQPDREPPEARGIWGRLLDHIYRLQRQSKEAQGRLESSIQYLQDSLKSVRDAAIITDPWGNIAWVNDSAESLLGISLNDDVGRPLVNLMRIRELSQYLSLADYSQPLRLLPTSEREACLQVEVSTFSGGDRLIFVKDISEQYKLEVMRRDFVGNVSHELRTPLTVLKGYVENIQSLESELVDQIARPLAQMEMQVVRMEVLLKDLLWLSRIESIEGADKTSPINMASLVNEIAEDLRAAWPQRELICSMEYDGMILGDAVELHSAVSNLVVNALKYSGADSCVMIRWSRVDGQPTLSVIDEGEGIEPQHIPRLTERFYRVDKSRSQNTGGTGLGLAIVKHVALSHNAELVISSVYGKGSEFALAFAPQEDNVD